MAQTSAVGPPAGMATFKSGVDLVTVSAVVRDQKGRVVTDLTRADFELLDSGERRPITDFRAERAGVSVALLFDASGSMQVAAKIESARQAARHVLAWLKPGRTSWRSTRSTAALRQLQPFAPYREDASLERSMVGIAPFGMTSLNDAIAATAKELAGRPNAHRAVVVLTDGVDNNSRLSAPEVSGIASSIDVPVYILAVVSPLDHVGGGDGGEQRAAGPGRRPGRPGAVDGRRVLRHERPGADEPGRPADRRGASSPVRPGVRTGQPARVASARGAGAARAAAAGGEGAKRLHRGATENRRFRTQRVVSSNGGRS